MSDEQSRSLNDNQSGNPVRDPGGSNLESIPDGFTELDEPAAPEPVDQTGGTTARDPDGSNLESIPDGFTGLEEPDSESK